MSSKHTHTHATTKCSFSLEEEKKTTSNENTHVFACISITQYCIFYIGLAVASKCLSSLSVMHITRLSGSLLCHPIPNHATCRFFMLFIHVNISIYICVDSFSFHWHFYRLSSYGYFFFLSHAFCVYCVLLLPFIYTIK